MYLLVVLSPACGTVLVLVIEKKQSEYDYAYEHEHEMNTRESIFIVIGRFIRNWNYPDNGKNN